MMYHHIIGSLMYLMNMRLDICFAVNTLSQFLTDLRHVHLIAAKHIMRYLRGICHIPDPYTGEEDTTNTNTTTEQIAP